MALERIVDQKDLTYQVGSIEVTDTLDVGGVALTVDAAPVAAGAAADHTHALEVTINGVTYYIMLADSNAAE